jgi:DNA (cytosine-5)-methyltransferase 1
VSGAYWREHGVLARHINGVASRAALPTLNATQRWRTVRDVLRDLPVPDALDASQPYHPDHYRIDGCREYRGHTGSTMDQPAKTLKAGVHGVPGGENMVRLSNGMLRYFSLHESALLQTFPSDYVFRGTRSAVIRQIGNAAPTEVVRLLADRLRRTLGRASDKGAVMFRTPHVDLIDGKALSQL